MKNLLEICCNSYESALAAKRGGADRIELCSVLGIGGVTPSYGTIASVQEAIDIDINVLIRPREGNFVYSDGEDKVIKRDIEMCGRMGVNGVVLGALDQAHRINLNMCREWVYLAHSCGLSVTFHRAIDVSSDILEAMEDVISLGCERILSSGGSNSAMEGVNILQKMVQQAGDRIVIMPGAGINPSNIEAIAVTTGAHEFHFSASRKSNYGTTVSDEETVRQAAKLIKNNL